MQTLGCITEWIHVRLLHPTRWWWMSADEEIWWDNWDLKFLLKVDIFMSIFQIWKTSTQPSWQRKQISNRHNNNQHSRCQSTLQVRTQILQKLHLRKIKRYPHTTATHKKTSFYEFPLGFFILYEHKTLQFLINWSSCWCIRLTNATSSSFSAGFLWIHQSHWWMG